MLALTFMCNVESVKDVGFILSRIIAK